MFDNFKSSVYNALFPLVLAFFFLLQTPNGAQAQTLWKISKNGNHSYLLGSVHFLKKENYPLPEKIYKAFDECSDLVLEADMDSLKLPQTAARMMQISQLANEQLFKDVVSPEIYKKASDYLSGLGVSIQFFPRSKPWFIAMTITALEATKMGMDATLGLDYHFAEKAQERNMPLIGLESIDFQMNLFNDLPMDLQVAFLEKTLEDSKDAEEDMTKMLHAWEKGKNNELQQLLSKGFNGFPQLYDRLLVERNKTWVPKIEDLLSEGKKYFIVVGAGHLTGNDSVVQLLKARGIKTKKL
ncbi:MAG: TraB/GumN family protein [Deferribacteres bacterium]|nr:TraB/GumN family protein [candidate division KSB1 bacterium]MCB9502318.1 TraB/GumN family protein [Deferribacteres bacterium]